ncbi:MAG: DUF3422 domain-containing protein [Pseudomonadota bacterium]
MDNRLKEHPQRLLLYSEVHARPPESIEAPARLSYLVLLGDGDLEPLRELCTRYGVDQPARDASHFSADMGPFRIRFERHTEFTRYLFAISGASEIPFEKNAIDSVPKEWLENLEGELMVAIHIAVLEQGSLPAEEEAISKKYFSGNALVGSRFSGGKGRALTDLRIHADSFSRLLVEDGGTNPRQMGRYVQRLLEIDTYRILALLAFPVARGLMPFLSSCEDELTEIAAEMSVASEREEPVLLDRLTRLHAEIVRTRAESAFRFSAALAYAGLVRRRIDELRETRIEGTQTFEEFTQRRLAPAMETCATVGRRLAELSEQVTRATQLLSTRVDVSRERQNRELLESMDRRASLQLRLQQTVEGLSIAAITYYIVGLVGYAASGIQSAGLAEINAPVVIAVSIPIVLAAVAFGVRKVRTMISRDEDHSH